MASAFVPASALTVARGQTVERLDDGSVRSPLGAQGLVLQGPGMLPPAGVYRIGVKARVLEPAEAETHLDIFGGDRLHASRRFRDGCEAFVRVTETHLEFRFTAAGESFLVEGVELDPLLLDDQAASADEVVRLAERLLAAGAEPAALYHLFDRLAGLGRHEEVERLRAAFLAGGGRPLARVRALLQQLHGARLPADIPEDGPPLSRQHIHDAVCARAMTVFDGFNLTLEHRAALLERGYHPDFIQANRLDRFAGEPRRAWREPPGQLTSPSGSVPGMPLFNRRSERNASFQVELALHGSLSAYCPVSGRRVVSRHGFVQWFCSIPFFFYRFEGAEVFYVCTGYHANDRVALYLPRSQTLIDFWEPLLRWHSLTEITRAFEINLVTCGREAAIYLDGPTRPAAVTGNDNLGHFMWTDLSGLHYAAANGLLDSITELVEFERAFLPVTEVFPEMTGLPATRFSDGEAAFAHCLRNRMLPIRFTDAVISEGLAARLRRAAERHGTDGRQPPSDLARPLLWINLRAHNKRWVGQAGGYAALVNAIRDEFGACTVFLDGWTDCADIAAEIRAQAHPDIAFHDGLGFGVSDSLNWAFAIDAYVSTISAGLTLVTWIANKPGVAHAETAHLDQMGWWGHVRSDAIAPRAPGMSDVHDVAPGGLYCDYELDWRVLWRLLQPILRERFASSAASQERLPSSGGRG